MANKTAFQARFREAMRGAVRKFLEEEELPDAAEGEALFTVIEDLALNAGDAVSLEVFQNAAVHAVEGSNRVIHCRVQGH